MVETMDRTDKTNTDYCGKNHIQTRHIDIVKKPLELRHQKRYWNHEGLLKIIP